MRINNVSTETSSRTVIVLSIIVSVITVLLIWGYMATSVAGISFVGFFQWLVGIFQSLRAEMTEDPIVPWIILLFLLGTYIGFIVSIISRYNALKRFNSEINVKYINLMPGGIEFFFTRPENNFMCAYSDIEELYIDIQSQLVRTKNGSYIAFEQMNLTFTATNGKTFKLSNTTSSPMKLIYKIIDWTRNIQKFEYGFSGYGEIPDYKEKIDEYLHLGYKDIVGKDGENKLKVLSLIFFALGIFFVFSFADVIPRINRDPWILAMLLPFMLFLIISFIFDIILVVDEIRDNKYRGYNG